MKLPITLGAGLLALAVAVPASAQDIPPSQPPKVQKDETKKKQDPKAKEITVWVMEAKGKG